MLIIGKFNINDISGPVGTIALMSNSISSVNKIFDKLIVELFLLCLISINLGIMNLIPIPALDGGRIIESLIELIINNQINKKIISLINTITMTILLIFMFYILFIDIHKVFLGVFNVS